MLLKSETLHFSVYDNLHDPNYGKGLYLRPGNLPITQYGPYYSYLYYQACLTNIDKDRRSFLYQLKYTSWK